jgi:glycosyltransferase involved in cell wall biosynthesis
MSEQLHKSAGQQWLILSHAFNMDGRAASQTITDKIPYLLEKGIVPIVISAQTGTKDCIVEHYQVPAIAPSGLKFDLRHILKKHICSPFAYRLVKGLANVLLLPLYAIDRACIHLESQWSWFFMAYAKGSRIIREKLPSIIYSTGGANSAHFAGYLLARRYSIPWIAELHDPMIHGDWRGSRMSFKWAAYLEEKICNEASAAWWFTDGALAKAKERNPSLGNRGHMIIPGVQAPDFQLAVYRKRDKVHFGHFGSLSETRNLAVFFEALHRLLHERPEYKSVVQVDIYGSRLDPVSRKALQQFCLTGIVAEHGRLESDPLTGKSGRQQVLEAMRQADALILLHGSDPFCEEYIPSKLFEYLWSKRPIIGMIWKNPQLEGILLQRSQISLNALDVAGLQEALLLLLKKWEAGQLSDCETLAPFTVQNAVEKIVDIAQDIIATSPSRGDRPK